MAVRKEKSFLYSCTTAFCPFATPEKNRAGRGPNTEFPNSNFPRHSSLLLSSPLLFARQMGGNERAYTSVRKEFYTNFLSSHFLLANVVITCQRSLNHHFEKFIGVLTSLVSHKAVKFVSVNREREGECIYFAGYIEHCWRTIAKNAKLCLRIIEKNNR